MNTKLIKILAVVITLLVVVSSVSIITVTNKINWMIGQLGQNLNVGATGSEISGYASTTSATVATSNTIVFATSTAGNPRRTCDITNSGSYNVYLSIGTGATVGKGAAIFAQGGSYKLSIENQYQSAIYGIADGGASNLAILCK